MSRLTHRTRTLLLFGCTSFAALLGACGGSGNSGTRFISVSWSAKDLSIGQQAPCSQLEFFDLRIHQVDDSLVYFDRQNCSAGVTYSATARLQKGVYNGSLEFVSPNGTVLSAEAVDAFDVTPVGELALTRNFTVNDVCARNRYFYAEWSVDHGVGTARLSCQQSSGFSVVLDVDSAPPQSFELSQACDDQYRPSNWTGASEDGLPPGSYSVGATLIDSSGADASTAPNQIVTVDACGPGVLGAAPTFLQFGIR